MGTNNYKKRIDQHNKKVNMTTKYIYFLKRYRK